MKPNAKDRTLVHQPQPTADTCVHACIAMLTGIEVNKVRKKYSPDFQPIFWDDVQAILKHNKVESIRYANNWLPWNRVMLLSVPSLNITGRLHAIIVVTNDDNMDIYDPNWGKEGLKSYGEDCDITSYGDIIEVFPFCNVGCESIKDVQQNAN
jgi:hypothetical protein